MEHEVWNIGRAPLIPKRTCRWHLAGKGEVLKESGTW